MRYIVLTAAVVLLASCGRNSSDRPVDVGHFDTSNMELIADCPGSTVKIYFDQDEPAYYAVDNGNAMRITPGLSAEKFCEHFEAQINPGPEGVPVVAQAAGQGVL